MTPPPAFPAILPVVICALLLQACGAPRPRPTLLPAPHSPSGAAAKSGASVSDVRPSRTSPDDVNETAAGVFGDSAGLDADRANPTAPVWDMDVHSYETHARVEHYVNLFSGSSRQYFQERLSRGTRYQPMIREKLRAGGLPEDLTYLALIESGYDPNAYSRAAAVGMWQFMSTTARAVGMRVDWWIDDRRDPAKATDGAIRFLRDLQKQFGSVYLAAAAYNGGPGRVARGLTRFADELKGVVGDAMFFGLAGQDYLRAETKNYVPQLIAAALVAKRPERYDLVVDSLPPYGYDSARVEPGTSLAMVAVASGATVEEVRYLNPSVLRGIAPPDGSLWVHVPTGLADRTRAALDSMPAEEKRGFREVAVTGTTLTPTTLARREKVTVQQLQWFNPSLRTTKSGRLVSGQRLRIPAAHALQFARDLPDPGIERYGSTAATLSNSVHLVRRGETISGLARKYGMSQAQLKSLNAIKGSRLVVGQKLTVKKIATTKKAGVKRAPAKSARR